MPFIFHEENENKNFEQYYCLLNLNELFDEIQKSYLTSSKFEDIRRKWDGIERIKFRKCVKAFKIRF